MTRLTFGRWLEWDGSRELPPDVRARDVCEVGFIGGNVASSPQRAGLWSWRYYRAQALPHDIARYRLLAGHPAYRAA